MASGRAKDQNEEGTSTTSFGSTTSFVDGVPVSATHEVGYRDAHVRKPDRSRLVQHREDIKWKRIIEHI